MANKVTMDGGQAPSNRMPSFNRPKPKPTFQPKTPASYVAPIQNYQPQVSPIAAPSVPYNGGGGGAISQPGSVTASFAAPMPAAPVEPPKPSPADITKMAEVDSTFMDQKSMYANALKKYIEDYTRQKKGLELDADTAVKGIGRNRETGLTGLSEDFAARGLSNSGMFADNLDKADDQYDKQEINVKTGLTNSVGDLNFRKSKYEAENGANGTNIQAARREAYARLAAAQGLT